jgi:hypothetical protein
MKRIPFLALAIAALSACASGARHRPPCATSGVCGTDGLCVAGVCRPKKEIPTESGTRKLELLPDRWAVVTSQGAQPWTGVDIPFGRASEGHVVLLLRFPSPLRETSRVVSALIVLDPMPGVAPSPSLVPVTLSRVLGPWTQQEASWTRLPELSPVEENLIVSNWGMRPLYIDVTHQVWRWREQRGDEQGLAIIAAPQNAIGASYSLGLAGGRGPRLEVYVR